MKKNNSNIQRLRLAVQLSFLVFIVGAGLYHKSGGPSIDALCPFGALESLFAVLVSGDFLKRIFTSNYVLLAGTVILAAVLSRYFCGWICALGTLQELFGKAGQKLFGKRWIIPVKADKYFRYIKYILLAVILFFTWKTAELVVRPYDPWAAFGHITEPADMVKEFFWGSVILFGSLAASMFVGRFFCKYMCPMGAFLGIMNKFSIYRIKRDEDTCIHCRKCTQACPVNIDVESLQQIDDSECINCMTCITECPTGKGTLKPTIKGRAVDIRKAAAAGTIIFVGLILITNVSGIWIDKNLKLSEMKELNMEITPEDIKGSIMIGDIIDTFNLNEDEFFEKTGINKEEFGREGKIKEAGEALGKDMEDIRNDIRIMMGMEPVYEESTE